VNQIWHRGLRGRSDAGESLGRPPSGRRRSGRPGLSRGPLLAAPASDRWTPGPSAAYRRTCGPCAKHLDQRGYEGAAFSPRAPGTRGIAERQMIRVFSARLSAGCIRSVSGARSIKASNGTSRIETRSFRSCPPATEWPRTDTADDREVSRCRPSLRPLRIGLAEAVSGQPPGPG